MKWWKAKGLDKEFYKSIVTNWIMKETVWNSTAKVEMSRFVVIDVIFGFLWIYNGSPCCQCGCFHTWAYFNSSVGFWRHRISTEFVKGNRPDECNKTLICFVLRFFCCCYLLKGWTSIPWIGIYSQVLFESVLNRNFIPLHCSQIVTFNGQLAGAKSNSNNIIFKADVWKMLWWKSIYVNWFG